MSPARPAAALLLAVTALVGLAPAAAARPGLSPRPLAANGRPAPHIAAGLDRVQVTGSRFTQARAAYLAIAEQLTADRRTHRAAVRELERLRSHAGRLEAAIRVDTALARRTRARIAVLERRLRDLALDAYMGIGTDDSEAAASSGIDLPAQRRAQAKTVLRNVVAHDSAGELTVRQGTLARALARLARNRSDLTATRASIASTVRTREESQAAAVRDAAQEQVARADLAEARAVSWVADTDLPLVALDAYRHAAALANEASPGCAISWTLLAGIGDVESRQGTYTGGGMDPLGQIAVPIYGPMLDGTHGNKRLPDSDQGTIDGTPKGDRAVGPMQFIPTTWRAMATDGDDDGAADPANIYDAAATAAHYLCRRGPGLDTPAGRTRAILSYNDSGDYAAEVSLLADRYAAAVVIPPPARHQRRSSSP